MSLFFSSPFAGVGGEFYMQRRTEDGTEVGQSHNMKV